MTFLYGKPIRQRLLTELGKRIEAGERITAYVIYNPASFEAGEYMKLVSGLIGKLGQTCSVFPVSSRAEALLAMDKASADPLGSVFLCRPLLVEDENGLTERISPRQDADMLTSANLGRLAHGDLRFLSGTSSSVSLIIDEYRIPTEGRKTIIIGRSPSVGLPVSLMMLKRNAFVSIAHSKTPLADLRLRFSESDIAIMASGRRGLIRPEDIRPNQIIIDCGYQTDGQGDLGFVPECAGFTPVPGGVGPVTIAALVMNAFRLHEIYRD